MVLKLCVCEKREGKLYSFELVRLRLIVVKGGVSDMVMRMEEMEGKEKLGIVEFKQRFEIELQMFEQ